LRFKNFAFSHFAFLCLRSTSCASASHKSGSTVSCYGFYALSLSLAIGIAISLIQAHKPLHTFWDIIISSVSIGVMYYVTTSQIKPGEALKSQPIVSDASTP
jgi:hypothetical protein